MDGEAAIKQLKVGSERLRKTVMNISQRREREKERLADGMFSLCVCVRESALNPIEVVRMCEFGGWGETQRERERERGEETTPIPRA